MREIAEKTIIVILGAALFALLVYAVFNNIVFNGPNTVETAKTEAKKNGMQPKVVVPEFSRIYVYTLDSCEYIVSNEFICHKANCKNQIHAK